MPEGVSFLNKLKAAISKRSAVFTWAQVNTINEPESVWKWKHNIQTHASSSPGTSRKEITEHWEWLEHNLLQTLSIFENENDITTFVKGKVQVRSTKRRLVFGQENSCKLETCWLRIEVKSCWEVLEAQASKASLENPPQPLDAEFQLLPLKRIYTSN